MPHRGSSPRAPRAPASGKRYLHEQQAVGHGAGHAAQAGPPQLHGGCKRGGVSAQARGQQPSHRRMQPPRLWPCPGHGFLCSLAHSSGCALDGRPASGGQSLTRPEMSPSCSRATPAGCGWAGLPAVGLWTVTQGRQHRSPGDSGLPAQGLGVLPAYVEASVPNPAASPGSEGWRGRRCGVGGWRGRGRTGPGRTLLLLPGPRGNSEVRTS